LGEATIGHVNGDNCDGRFAIHRNHGPSRITVEVVRTHRAERFFAREEAMQKTSLLLCLVGVMAHRRRKAV
jgi:hypothetical protein